MCVRAVADSANSACLFSGKSQTAVDSQRLAGDEVRTGGEKKHRLSDIRG